MKSGPPSDFLSYGSIGYHSLNLMREAFPSLLYQFSVAQSSHATAFPSTMSPRQTIPGPRYPLHLLNRMPVDLLFLECGHLQKPKPKPGPQRHELMIGRTDTGNRPAFVVEIWPGNSHLWERGPTGKSSTARWQSLGYATRMRLVDAQHCGGAIVQPRLIVVRGNKNRRAWRWAPLRPDDPLRPMSNLLLPRGLLPKGRTDGTPPSGQIPDSSQDPMPSAARAWIKADNGHRRLLLEETGKGLGVGNDLLPRLSLQNIRETTSVFHWEYVSQCILQVDSSFVSMPVSTQLLSSTGPPDLRAEASSSESIAWVPPNMLPGSEWTQRRIANLDKALNGHPEAEQMRIEGLEALRIHRLNYDASGPDLKRLQLLWWEFPPEHWTEVREGGKMNFLQPPTPQIHQNANMTEDQLATAAEFVDELIGLGALRLPPAERAVLLTAPLFVVPKPGQPGQWRCIADMLRGGQNENIGPDPVYLPRAGHILDQLYSGGWSAVLDLSKYFHNFPTHPDDRPYLGTLHPVTEELFEYWGLPMGAGNSPAIACRIGQGFLRMLRNDHELFQGLARDNCWWTGFRAAGGYDPAHGYGYVLEGREGLSVKIWGFVDDFLIHGPTRDSVERATEFFLDAACRVGLMCHPKKCTPAGQCVKYIGFLFDTSDIPCLCIPQSKRERALAIIDHLLFSPPTQVFSRLSLSVASGVLQSLVDATPSNLGATYLRQFHSTVRPDGLGQGLAPYLTRTAVPPEVRRELKWWQAFLESTRGRHGRLRNSATLVPNWGDGSGTGTGGTLGIPDQPLRMWQGQWHPVVFGFSSNWKEMATLLLTMQQLRTMAKQQVEGTTIFYFTDNSTVYWISQGGSSPSPRLHEAIEKIKLIELELNCILQVVHVPGVIMILQGTDGLSRGVWATPYQGTLDQRALTESVFAPLLPDPKLVEHCASTFKLPGNWETVPWRAYGHSHRVLDRATAWFPPPELARQLISFILESWVERPLTTSALIIVPRTVPAFWFGLSRYVRELTMFRPAEFPFVNPPRLEIPIVVLYLASHVRTLPPKNRLDRSPLPSGAIWHRKQAETMRRLPPRSLA